jgi:hypothetical protein
MTQRTQHKASNLSVNHSSYINQGTSQLGFSISTLMNALTKDDLKAKEKPIQVPKSQVKANTGALEMRREKCMFQPKTLINKGSSKANHNRRVKQETQELHAVLKCYQTQKCSTLPLIQKAYLKRHLSKTLITIKSRFMST